MTYSSTTFRLLQRAVAAILCVAGATLAQPATQSAVPSGQRPVVVYTASPGGIMAAVAAAQEGASVVVVEPSGYVGGIVAQGGLVLSDLGNEKTIAGLARDFFRRIEQHYASTYGPKSEQREHTKFQDYPGGCFEPRVAEEIFERHLAEHDRITVIRNAAVVSVNKDGNVIRSIVVGESPENRKTIEGSVFIDASYTGDLLALAGVSFHIGREARDDYGESLARNNPDRAIQAYNYRLTLTNNPDNRVSIAKPDGYDPERYRYQLEGILRNKPYRLTNIFRPYWRLPNQKQDTNVADLAGENHGYPLASYEERRAIEKRHRDYSLGFIYFLQNDPRVPEEIRVPAREWGLPADEFADNGHFPRQIYVREARRMRGEYVMRQQDLQDQRRKPDGVALGSYAIDSHAVKTYKDEKGVLRRDGYLFVPVKPYAIPYRAMLPKRDEASNLLVPVVMSSTHVAWASMRMEPVFMMTGEAAGVAAAMSTQTGTTVHSIDTDLLRSKLAARGAMVDVPPEPIAAFTFAPAKPAVGELVRLKYVAQDGASVPVRFAWDFNGDGETDSVDPEPTFQFGQAKRTLVSLVVFDAEGNASSPVAQAVDVGGVETGDAQLDSEDPTVKAVDTLESINQQPFWGSSFKHDGNVKKGRVRVSYPFDIAEAGRYRVYITSTKPGGRSTNTPVTVSQGAFSRTERIDQNVMNNPFGLLPVGEFDFNAGEPLTIVLGNDDTDNYTIFDVVRVVKLP